MIAITQQGEKVQQVLKYTYGLIPIVAGLDKFTNLLADWKNYLGDSAANWLPFGAGTFISIVGIIEMGAGVLVLFRPRIGAYVVMAWLIAIALMLIFGGHYFDIAVRDLVMAIGAWSLGKLSTSGKDESLA